MADIDPTALLAYSASLQIFVSSLLGALMLIPMQPWGKSLRPKLDMRALLATHLDWLMLAFMQGVAAFLFMHWPETKSRGVAIALVFGGWINPVSYLFRGFGVNAFAFAGPPLQRAAATLVGVSAACIIAAWAMILWRFRFHP
ncbi:MAG: hypothetical protein ACRENE_30040 [Polyangiaceae bacterium]